ncbi:MAG: peptidylprolyl isomerase [Thermodesulfobacteriota bacterium]|nr:peptidylprolyl isomerase [Thermodesulfobacteriota bacterium]
MNLKNSIIFKKTFFIRYLLSFSVYFPLLFICISCDGEEKIEKQILAKIGGHIITVGEFNREFDTVQQEYLSFDIKDKDSLKELKMSFLNRLIERKIILIEAERLGIHVSEDELEAEVSSIKKDYPGNSFQETLISEYVSYEDWQEKIRMKILTEKLINDVIISHISIEDEEVAEYYETHPDDFLIPQQVRARQIVVATEREAREILQSLQEGEDFKKLAMERSLSPDGEKGGDLGYLTHAQVPQEFDKVIFSLPKGVLSKVVKSPYGFHIFRVEGKRKARKVFLHEVYDKIKESLRQKKAEEEYLVWLEKIKGTIKTRINYQLLEEQGDEKYPLQ